MGTEIGSANFRRAEFSAIKDGKVTVDEVKDLVDAAKGEDKQVIRQMLATDAFEPAARTKVEALLGKNVKGPEASQIAGANLGRGVTVLRELGTTGYADQFQAISAARLTGLDNTGVVLGKDNLWHPVQLNKEQTGLLGDGNPVPGVRSAVGLKNTDPAKVKQLQTELRGMLEDLHAKKPVDAEALNKKRTELAAEIFGVPPSQVNIIGRSSDRQTGMININTHLADDGKHGAEQSENQPFDARALPAVEISSRLIEGEYKDTGFKDGKTVPAHFEPPRSIEEARTTLFHEATHEADYDKAAEWVRKWEGGTRYHPARTFDPQSAADVKSLAEMMTKQKADPATVRSVVNFVKGDHADTEARAYLSAAVIAMQSGNTAAARDQLMTFAGGLEDGRVPNTNDGTVTKAKLAEVKAAFKAMPKDQQKEFRALWDEVTKAHPGWPGAKLDLK